MSEETINWYMILRDLSIKHLDIYQYEIVYKNGKRK